MRMRMPWRSKRRKIIFFRQKRQYFSGERKVVVTIVYPRNNSARYKATRRAIGEHHGLSFDNIGFVALLCNDKRQKQHIYI